MGTYRTLSYMRRFLALGLLVLGACSSPPDEPPEEAANEDAVTVDTSTPEARAQYDANVAFARSYTARCAAPTGEARARKRVLVTGFGRFLSNARNATGLVVSRLVPGMTYPETAAPAAGEVDPPGPQLAVARGAVALEKAGDVEVCAMVLPVYWDLAAILVAKELDAFAPDLVVMNGIAGPAQDLWIELGAVNRAMALTDGSNLLAPLPPPGASHAPIVPSAAASQGKRGNLLSWSAVKDAAAAAIVAQGSVSEGGDELRDVLHGAKLAGFPRSSNTYLCNNVTYAVSYLMSHANRSVTLLKASRSVPGKVNSVPTRVARDLAAVPRVFVHWPGRLDHGQDDGPHVEAAASVLRAMIDAQLGGGAAPTVGDNALAEVAPSGDTF